MNVLDAIRRPEYLYRPIQIWRRLQRDAIVTEDQIQLAWGLPVRINPSCLIGIDILNVGLFDRIVPESICRLLEPGECTLDIGSNIGQNASIMALVAGQRGSVIAFEPHPDLWKILTQNVRRWADYDLASIRLVAKGLSSQAGITFLYEGGDFAGNQGAASLEIPSIITRKHKIKLTTLDAFLPADAKIGLAKLDVEGHEATVLRGAEKLLSTGRLRDLIFEDYQPQPSPATEILEATGYTVFKLYATWRRPCLLPLLDAVENLPNGLFSFNYLATLDPDRVRARFHRPGWQCLRLQARKKS